MTAVIAFGPVLLVILAECALWIVCLRVGLRWPHVESVSLRKLLAVMLMTKLGQFCLILALSRLEVPDEQADMVVRSVAVGGLLLIPIFTIIAVFRLSVLQSVKASLPTFIASIIGALLGYLIVGNVTEAFVVSSNSMAPTLLGQRLSDSCSECGEICYSSFADLAFHESGIPTEAICPNFHITESDSVTVDSRSSDRMVAAKYLDPNRWDLIAFRQPDDPSTVYVMRLVGLPGEEVIIRDGTIFANGQRLTPPETLRGIRYMTDDDGHRQWPANWGSPEQPAKLGTDEYFVLGDCSVRSRDSRLWEHGAPGHPPYAVPASYVVGVVTHIYWPISRWRVFR